MFLSEYLEKESISSQLASVINDIAEVSTKVMCAVGGTEVAKKLDSNNASGDTQMAIDVIANTLFVDVLRANVNVALIGSEEVETFEKFRESGFAVMFDPLDGSSLLDVNLSIGSIVGIYPIADVVGQSGDKQIASMIFVYGPRLTMMMTVRNGTHEFTYLDGKFVMTQENIRLEKDSKMYAPGNLRAVSSNKNYRKLIDYWLDNEYTLRYSGGMVPDVNQILLKRCGIFTYPGYDNAPKGKLRLLYECAPISLLVEQAGGMASDGEKRILEIEITDPHQKTPIVIGKSDEVSKACAILR